MHILLLTNEYPPHIYGGAGVHVEHLTQELVRLDDGTHRVDVLCFGDQDEDEDNLRVQGVPSPGWTDPTTKAHRKVFDALERNLVMASSVDEVDVVHCHTWYSHWAGILASELTGAPLVLTTHSLEPHRPWKAEQLGTGYRVSSWIERAAYERADGVIAVSSQMKEDVCSLYDVDPERARVIPNGIDLDVFRPESDAAVLEKYDIDTERPYVLFVGRITRQKGILHLVRALEHLPRDAQVVLCAGAPDTEEIEREMTELVREVQEGEGPTVHWIAEMVPREELVSIYAGAALFVCPSVYEPFGIINLEAMATGTPVVASQVGGIPDIIDEGETGLLVSFDQREDDFEPTHPDRFARDLADAIGRLLEDEETRQRMGRRAREVVEERFGWRAIARRTLDYYRELAEATTPA